MSNEADPKFDLDLHFLPAWAQQPATANLYANFSGEDSRPGRRDFRSPRPGGPRRDGPPRDSRQGAPGGPRFDGPRRGGPRRGGPERGERFERREPAQPLPELEVSIVPEEKGVESLAKQIRLTGRAYPLFDIGFLILKKPERYNFRLSVIKKPDGQVVQSLFKCSIDDSLWLSDREAMDHILSKHFSIFYQDERIPAEPPKGKFTFVAQCGMSGEILGPPNYHNYQTKLHQLHSERFAHMPFEVFKARVKIVADEAVVKKWIEDQSFTTQYLCLNVPDTLKLNSREEVEKHFREVHLANVIQPIETFVVGGAATRSVANPQLQSLFRRALDEQRRFPMKVVTTLSQMFASQGLQFFKVNKTITHVAVSRPHYLDVNAGPISAGIRKIIEYINAKPGTNRKKMLDELAPGAVAAAPVAPVAPAEPAAEGAAPTPVPAEAPAALSAEVNALISDLHWLIHQGHVIEFANGTLETAKMPAPKPVRPPRPEAKPAVAAAPAEGAVPTEGAAPTEAAVEPAAPAEQTVAAAPAVEPAATPAEAAPAAPVVEPPASV
jgi:hypothetical protein